MLIRFSKSLTHVMFCTRIGSEEIDIDSMNHLLDSPVGGGGGIEEK